jgi:hypothetical protein
MLCAVVCVATLGESPTPNSLNHEGLARYGSAWIPALGAWLPSFGDGDEPWRRGEATQIAQHDGFQYEND